MFYTKGKINSKRILLLGLGKREEIELDKIRKAADIAVKYVKRFKATNLAILP